MNTTTPNQPASAERPATDRAAQERKEPSYLFTEKHVAEKSEIARRFLDTRERLNVNVEKANNFLVKRFYNIDHNTYLEGSLPAKTKELIAIAVGHATKCPYCIDHHVKGAKKAGATEQEISEAILVAIALSAGAAFTHAGMAYEAFDEQA